MSAIEYILGIGTGITGGGGSGAIPVSNVVVVQKTPGAGEFSSVKDAIDSITTATSSNPWLVKIYPGIYIEDTINLKSYVYVAGEIFDSVIIKVDATTKNIIEIVNNTIVANVTLEGATSSGKSAVHYSGSSLIDVCIFRSVKFGSNYYHAYIEPNATTCSISFSEVFYGGAGLFNTGFIATGISGGIGRILIKNSTSVAGISASGFAVADGPGTQIVINGCQARNSSNAGNAFMAKNGGTLRMTGVSIAGWERGIYLPDTGSGTFIRAQSINFENNVTWDLLVEHPGATGYVEGVTSFTKVYLGTSEVFIPNKNPKIITVSKSGGDFDSIKDAVDFINDASSLNPYVVNVGPGLFVEDTITMKQYVSIVGNGDQASVIMPSGINNTIIIGIDNSRISNLFLTGATGASGKAIYLEGAGTNVPFLMENCVLGNNTLLCDIFGNTLSTTMQIRTCRFGGISNFTNGFKITNNPGISTLLFVNSSVYQDIITPFPSGDLFFISGVGSGLIITDFVARTGSPTGNAVVFQDGAGIRLLSCGFRGYSKAIWNKNIGDGCTISGFSVGIEECTEDIILSHPDTTGSFSGSADREKMTIDPNINIPLFLTSSTANEVVFTGKLVTGDTHDSLVDITDLIESAPTMGVMDGGILTDGGGLNVNVSAGFGYLMSGAFPIHILSRYDWDDTILPISANSNLYIIVNSSGIMTTTGAFPFTPSNILLGRVVTHNSGIEFIDKSPVSSHHLPNHFDRGFRRAFGPIYANGSITGESYPVGSFELDVTSGEYYFSGNRFLPSGASPITFDEYYRDGSGGYNRIVTQTTVNNTQYDNNSGSLTSIPANKFVKHSLYIVGDGLSEKYLFVYGQTVFDTLLEAEQGNIPTPPSSFIDGVALIASIIIEEGNVNIAEILDERPRLGFAPSATAASSSHGALSGLLSDDHPQYLLADGTRSLSGDLNIGGNSISNVNLVDGVDVSAHASRHLPNGADPLSTGIPSNIGTANSAGVANAFSKQDHIHDHSSQTDPTHHAIATTSAHGFMSSTDKGKVDKSSKYVELVDEFMVLVDTTANDRVGDLGWEPTFNGTASAITHVPSEQGHPGIISIASGNAAARQASIRINRTNSDIIVFGDGETLVDMYVRIPVLSTVTEEFIQVMGFADNVANLSAQVDGVYFEYDRLTSGDFWRAVTRNNSTQTATATSTAIVANTWYHLRIIVDAVGTNADFYVNNMITPVASITTNIPSGTGRETGLLFGSRTTLSTTGAKVLNVDRMRFLKTLTTSRE